MVGTPVYVAGRKIRFNQYHNSINDAFKHVINTPSDGVKFRELILQKYDNYLEREHPEITHVDGAFLEFIRSMYKNFGAEAGMDNHIIGTMYLGNFIFEKYRGAEGMFGFETTIQRESTYQKTHKKTYKMVRPDLLYITKYGAGIIAEIQNNGKLEPYKAQILRAFLKDVDNLSRIYIGFKERDSEKDMDRLCNDLVDALNKVEIDLPSVTLCIYPSNIYPFLDRDISDRNVANLVKQIMLN